MSTSLHMKALLCEKYCKGGIIDKLNEENVQCMYIPVTPRNDILIRVLGVFQKDFWRLSMYANSKSPTGLYCILGIHSDSMV